MIACVKVSIGAPECYPAQLGVPPAPLASIRYVCKMLARDNHSDLSVLKKSLMLLAFDVNIVS